MTASPLPTVDRRPCGTCPYRRDVPAGIWHPSEYRKLTTYDGETWEQSPGLFMCHQRNGCVCAGWVACHGADGLLALRMQPVDLSVYDYRSPVPVFSSGAEACAHGLSGVAAPGARASRAVRGLIRKRARRAALSPDAPRAGSEGTP